MTDSALVCLLKYQSQKSCFLHSQNFCSNQVVLSNEFDSFKTANWQEYLFPIFVQIEKVFIQKLFFQIFFSRLLLEMYFVLLIKSFRLNNIILLKYFFVWMSCWLKARLKLYIKNQMLARNRGLVVKADL